MNRVELAGMISLAATVLGGLALMMGLIMIGVHSN
jgi:hypothetical protein